MRHQLLRGVTDLARPVPGLLLMLRGQRLRFADDLVQLVLSVIQVTFRTREDLRVGVVARLVHAPLRPLHRRPRVPRVLLQLLGPPLEVTEFRFPAVELPGRLADGVRRVLEVQRQRPAVELLAEGDGGIALPVAAVEQLGDEVVRLLENLGALAELLLQPPHGFRVTRHRIEPEMRIARVRHARRGLQPLGLVQIRPGPRIERGTVRVVPGRRGHFAPPPLRSRDARTASSSALSTSR